MPQCGPTAYVFDAYGTLFDVHSAVARHAERVGPDAARLSEHWRIKQLEYCWVRTLAGAPFRDFAALTAEALDHCLLRFPARDPGVRDDLLAAYHRLDAFAEVPAALARLLAGGHRLAILSNGTLAMLEAALASAGLGGVFDCVISVDAVGRYKTAPEVYALAGERLGVEAHAISFQSSNRWDIAGARLAGFHTVWVNRAASPEDYSDCPPHRVIASLAEL